MVRVYTSRPPPLPTVSDASAPTHVKNDAHVTCLERVQQVGKAAMMVTATVMTGMAAGVATIYYVSGVVFPAAEAARYQAALLGECEALSQLDWRALMMHQYQAMTICGQSLMSAGALLASGIVAGAAAASACTRGFYR